MHKYTLLVIIFMITGCAAATTIAGVYAVGEVASVAVTDKTIDDHIVSSVKHQDCSVYRWIKGKQYCKDIPASTDNTKARTYCYKTLAGVDCYKEPLKNRNDYLLNP